MLLITYFKRILFLAFLFLSACNHHHPVDSLKNHSDSLQINTLFNKAVSEYDKAHVYISESEDIAKKNPALEDIHLAKLAKFFIQTGNIASADSILDKAMDTYKDNKEAYGLAKFFNLKAATAAYQNQQEKSVDLYKQALEILEKHHDITQVAAIQFNLANIFFSRLDYESSYKYINASKNSFAKTGDTAYSPIVNGILAIASIKLKNIEDGKKYAELSLAESKNKNPLGEILAYYALGELQLSNNNNSLALTHFTTAQNLSEKYKIPNLNLPIKAALLNTYNALSMTKEAIEVGIEALAIAKASNNIEIQYSLNRNLSQSYARYKNLEKAYDHIKEAEDIFRNSTITNNQEVLQKLLIEYETEKKSNLILIQENNIAQQKIWIITLIAFATIIVLVFIFYRRYTIQNRKMEQQRKEYEINKALTDGEEKERVRLANELHDGIASNLVAIKLQLESRSLETVQNHTIALVQKTHQEVRKVAHNLLPVDFKKQNWQDVLASFFDTLKTSATQIHFHKSEANIVLPANHALILYRCIQEVIQNALKHAHAQNIEVQLLKNKKELQINIDDDGKGFNVKNAENLNVGLFKYRSRLQQINADFELDSSLDKGTSIFIRYKTNS